MMKHLDIYSPGVQGTLPTKTNDCGGAGALSMIQPLLLRIQGVLRGRCRREEHRPQAWK